MADSLKYPWQQFIVDAYLEFNPELLPSKISVAEQAIAQRLCERPTDPEEQLALQDALTSLQVLMPKKARQEHTGKRANIA